MWPLYVAAGIWLLVLGRKAGVMGGGARVWPIRPKRVDKQGHWSMSGFGASRKRADGSPRLHAGIDMLCYPGDEIVAIEDGVVLHMVSGFAIGNGLQAVAVDHGDWQAIYAEIRVTVKPGQTVSAGDQLGRADRNGDGNTMLHLEAWERAPKGFTQWSPSYRPPGLLDITTFLQGL
jgi:murein DD-endopeptidase MepM/ murein hydrolase activator NlpD